MTRRQQFKLGRFGLRQKVLSPGSFDLSIILAAWMFSAWPFLRPNSYVYGFDSYAYTAPNLARTFTSWRNFQVPIWEQNFFGGVPFLGRLGAQGLYIVNLPFAVFSLNTALELITAMHLLILGCGVYVWLRYGLRFCRIAGVVSSVSVMSSSYLAVKVLSLDQLVALSWWPWVLYAIARILDGKRDRQTVGLLALFLTLLILGGHPQFIYMGFCLFGVVILFGRASWIELRSVFTFVLSLALALVASTLQLVSTYFLTTSSAMTSQRDLATLKNPAYVLPPSRSVIGLIGSPFNGGPSALTGTGEAVLGVGAVLIFLAFLGVPPAFKAHRRAAAGMLLLSFLAVALALGPRSPVFRLAYEIVPGFGNARVPGRWLALLLFTIPFFVGAGIEWASKQHKRRELVGIFVGWSALVVVSQAGRLADNGLESIAWWLMVGICVMGTLFVRAGREGGALAVVIAALLGAQVLASFSTQPANAAGHNESFEYATSEVLRPVLESGGRIFAQTYDRFDDETYMLNSLRPNTNLLFGIESLDGYDGGMWVQRRWISYAEALTTKPFNFDLTIRSQTLFPLNPELMARFGVRWLLLETEVASAADLAPRWNGPISRDGTLQLWENPNWLGTAVAYLKSEIAPSESTAALALQSLASNVVLIEDTELELTCDGDCPLQQVGESYRTNDSGGYVFEIAAPGILAIDRSWNKDWEVFVDGRKSSTFPVNGGFLGVKFDAGYHRVDYRFNPRWVDPALTASVIGFLVIIGLLISGSRRRNSFVLSDSDR